MKVQDSNQPQNPNKNTTSKQSSCCKKIKQFLYTIYIKIAILITNNLQPDIILKKVHKKTQFQNQKDPIFEGNYHLKQVNLNIEKQKYLKIYHNIILIFQNKNDNYPQFFIELQQPLQFLTILKDQQNKKYSQDFNNNQQLDRKDTQIPPNDPENPENNLEIQRQRTKTHIDEFQESDRQFVEKSENLQQSEDDSNTYFYDLENITLGKKNEEITLKISSSEQINLRNLRNVLKDQLFQRNFFSMYTITGKLGEGATAQVFLSVQKETNKQYATKVFDKKQLKQEEKWQKSLLHEIQMMKYLKQKDNIIQIHETFESNNHYYIVTELLMGGSLQDKIRKKLQLTQSEIIHIVRQILLGLQEMHTLGLMHRDIKPDNILFRSKDSLDLVIADLGFTQKIHSNNYVFLKCGTPGFVAPEIWKCSKSLNYNQKCDIFSLGVILYILLLGKNPFKAKKVEELIKNNQKCEIDFNSPQVRSLPRPAQRFLQKCLAYNPFQRPTTDESLSHDFITQIQQQKKRKTPNTPLNNLLKQYSSTQKTRHNSLLNTNSKLSKDSQTTSQKDFYKQQSLSQQNSPSQQSQSQQNNNNINLIQIHQQQQQSQRKKSLFSKNIIEQDQQSHPSSSLNPLHSQQQAQLENRQRQISNTSISSSKYSSQSKNKPKKSKKKKPSINLHEPLQQQQLKQQLQNQNQQSQILSYKNTDLKINLPAIDSEDSIQNTQNNQNNHQQSELSVSHQQSPSHYNSQINFPLYPYELNTELHLKSLQKKLIQNNDSFHAAQSPLVYDHKDLQQQQQYNQQQQNYDTHSQTSQHFFQNKKTQQLTSGKRLSRKLNIDFNPDHINYPLQQQNQFQNQQQQEHNITIQTERIKRKYSTRFYPFQTDDNSGNFLSPVPFTCQTQRNSLDKSSQYKRTSQKHHTTDHNNNNHFNFSQKTNNNSIDKYSNQNNQSQSNYNYNNDSHQTLSIRLPTPNDSQNNLDSNNNQNNSLQSSLNPSPYKQKIRPKNIKRHLTVPILPTNLVKLPQEKMPPQQQQIQNSNNSQNSSSQNHIQNTEEDRKEFIEQEQQFQYEMDLSRKKKRSPIKSSTIIQKQSYSSQAQQIKDLLTTNNQQQQQQNNQNNTIRQQQQQKKPSFIILKKSGSTLQNLDDIQEVEENEVQQQQQQQIQKNMQQSNNNMVMNVSLELQKSKIKKQNLQYSKPNLNSSSKNSSNASSPLRKIKIQKPPPNNNNHIMLMSASESNNNNKNKNYIKPFNSSLNQNNTCSYQQQNIVELDEFSNSYHTKQLSNSLIQMENSDMHVSFQPQQSKNIISAQNIPQQNQQYSSSLQQQQQQQSSLQLQILSPQSQSSYNYTPQSQSQQQQ